MYPLAHTVVSYFRSPVQMFLWASSLPAAPTPVAFVICFLTGPTPWHIPVPARSHMWVSVSVSILSRISFFSSCTFKNPIFLPTYACTFSCFPACPPPLWVPVSLWFFFSYLFSFLCWEAWWSRISGEWECRGILIFWLSDTSLKIIFVLCYIVGGKW